MHTIKAIYDGTNIIPTQPIPVKGKYEVFVTFVESVEEETPDINKPAKRSRSEFIGLLKGKVWMSDDFNEPLEEMKEYME